MIDMSTKLGGRVFQPALPVVDGNPPTDTERAFSQTLAAYSSLNIPIEAKSGLQIRERVLSSITRTCQEWMQYVCVQKKASNPTASSKIQLFTSGSYRLGVHEPGADIDTILVVPSVADRSDFFGLSEDLLHRDPYSLAERIRTHPDVTNFNAVEGAAIPLLTFDWEGINIDLLFARLRSVTIPEQFDVDNDDVLDGADSATEKSLNGPRVTNLIAAFVSGTPERYQTFLQVVRCVRKWAKARGLYSNKMGYWGGVNINIGVALTVQLYPNACAASLLRKFFLVFAKWRWPQPVMLNKPHDAGYGLQVWTLQNSARQVAPMITPAYPSMNSTLSVSRQTLMILQEEFDRAHRIVDGFWRDYQTGHTEIDWGRLFAPSDFFIAYPRYLSLCIVGNSQEDAQAWAGYVESRLRKLVSDLLPRSLPIRKIQLWPKKIEACIAEKSALLTQVQRQNSITYFIGFLINKKRLRSEQVNLELPLQNFRDWDLVRFAKFTQGMDVLCKDFRVKELPKICFEGLYKGGKEEAMKKRRTILDTDPIRIEKKKVKKLEELKAKMAEIQKKKDDKKRKREEAELEEQQKAVKEEQNGEDEPATVEMETAEDRKETDLLANALDVIQESVDSKTREEAEIAKQKLLSGELVDENDSDGYESDENVVGYSKDEARQVVVRRQEQPQFGKRSLPVSEEVMETLSKLNYKIVSDDDMIVLTVTHTPVPEPQVKKMKITFLQEFDMVQLDAQGHVIDKGDDDFTPSDRWIGRKAGFEFKLGERGLGYYRTGKAVVVPSNTAY